MREEAIMVIVVAIVVIIIFVFVIKLCLRVNRVTPASMVKYSKQVVLLLIVILGFSLVLLSEP